MTPPPCLTSSARLLRGFWRAASASTSTANRLTTTSGTEHWTAAPGRQALRPLSSQPRRASRMAMATSESAIPAAEQVELIELSKKAAAYQAVHDHLEPDYKLVGIGSGSTVVHVVAAIRDRGQAVTKHMSFFPTGAQSTALILNAGLTLGSLGTLPRGEMLDVCFDGADEVDDDLNLIKGGGACLWQEKMVATASRRFICVADYRKLSPRLGTNWKQGIPIEVHPMAARAVLVELEAIGSRSPRVRLATGAAGERAAEGGERITDNHMWIIDAPFMPLVLPRDAAISGDGEDGIWSVDKLASKLRSITGIAEIGLFHGRNGLEVSSGAQKPIAAYFGMANGEVVVRNAGSEELIISTRVD